MLRSKNWNNRWICPIPIRAGYNSVRYSHSARPSSWSLRSSQLYSMLHRTGKRSGTIHAINQISPKLAQIKHSVIPIPGDDGQVRLSPHINRQWFPLVSYHSQRWSNSSSSPDENASEEIYVLRIEWSKVSVPVEGSGRSLFGRTDHATVIDHQCHVHQDQSKRAVVVRSEKLHCHSLGFAQWIDSMGRGSDASLHSLQTMATTTSDSTVLESTSQTKDEWWTRERERDASISEWESRCHIDHRAEIERCLLFEIEFDFKRESKGYEWRWRTEAPVKNLPDYNWLNLKNLAGKILIENPIFLQQNPN